MARKSQHSVTKRRRESRKLEKATQKRARREVRRGSETKPSEAPLPAGDGQPPPEP